MKISVNKIDILSGRQRSRSQKSHDSLRIVARHWYPRCEHTIVGMPCQCDALRPYALTQSALVLAAPGAFSPAAAWKKTFLSLVFGRLRPKTKEKEVLFHPAGGDSGLVAVQPQQGRRPEV
jgi:hypothetical protein